MKERVKSTGNDFTERQWKNVDLVHWDATLPAGQTKQTTVLKIFECFRGKEGTYAIQNTSGSFRKVERPLTPYLVARHLAGDCTLALFVVAEGELVSLSAFNIQLPDFLARTRKLLSIVKDDVRRQCKQLQDLGIPSYVEALGLGRYRIWIVFDEFVPAWATTRLGRIAAVRCNPEIKDVGDKWGVYNFIPGHNIRGDTPPVIKLPLGREQRRHRANYDPSLFVDPDTLEPFPPPQQYELLFKIKTCSVEKLEEAIGEAIPGPHRIQEQDLDRNQTTIDQWVVQIPQPVTTNPSKLEFAWKIHDTLLRTRAAQRERDLSAASAMCASCESGPSYCNRAGCPARGLLERWPVSLNWRKTGSLCPYVAALLRAGYSEEVLGCLDCKRVLPNYLFNERTCHEAAVFIARLGGSKSD